MPRQMGKMKDWRNGNGRRNNQAAICYWNMLAHLFLLPIVKVSYRDGVECTSILVAVS